MYERMKYHVWRHGFGCVFAGWIVPTDDIPPGTREHYDVTATDADESQGVLNTVDSLEGGVE